MKVWNYFKTGRKFGIQAKRAKRLQLVEVPLMHNSPHPGEVIKELCLVPLDLTVTETAKALGLAVKHYLLFSMARQVLARKWRCVYLLLLIHLLRAGQTSNLSMISGEQNSVAPSYR